MKRPECPYCNSNAILVDGSIIYPHRPDLKSLKFWLCKPCDAFVGCHKKHPKYSPNGCTPLGRLANPTLRKLKSKAHVAFDPMWKQTNIKRTDAYAWLAEQLGIEKADCHIGMFDEEMCQRVIDVCSKQWQLPLKND